MDPFTAIMAAGSLALTLYGGHEKQQAAAQQEQVQGHMIGVEQQEEDVRQQIMHITANRQQMANARNLQRARSLIEAKGTAAGAQFGSAMGGGLGQASGEAGLNTQAISQDVQAGDTVFGLNRQLSSDRIQMALLGGTINQGQGLMDIGRSLGSNIQSLRSLGQYSMSGAQNMNLGNVIPGFDPFGGI